MQINHLVVACEQLLESFPDKQNMDLIQRLYNRKIREAFSLLQDYYMLPFLLQTNMDTEYWQASRAPSEALEYQLTLFKQTGVLPTLEQRKIPEKQWISLLIGLGCIPQNVDPLTKQYSIEEAQNKLQNLAAFIKKSAQSLPTYAAFKQNLNRKNATQDVGVKHAK